MMGLATLVFGVFISTQPGASVSLVIVYLTPVGPILFQAQGISYTNTIVFEHCLKNNEAATIIETSTVAKQILS